MSAPTAKQRKPWRVPITLVTVFGFGGLVALSVGLVLYLGLHTATENTSALLKIRSRGVVDALEARLDATMEPVVEQGLWIASHVARGTLDTRDLAALDTFMTGALAATPQVAGIGLVTPDAHIRRWGRVEGPVVVEDWSTRPDIRAWLRAGETRQGHAWSPPLWTHTIGQTVVVHDAPLRRDGAFLGMLTQIVPIAELSRTLAAMRRETGMVPFILYDEEYVLAHPLLSDWVPPGTGHDEPAPMVKDLGDAALLRLGRPDEVPFFLRGMSGLTAGGALVEGRYRVYLHRALDTYGPRAWTVGVHFDAETVAGDESRRIGFASQLGIGALLLAIATAVIAGRRLSNPVRLLARAADAVRLERFNNVPTLPQSRVRELDTALHSFRQMVDGLRERRLMRDVLGRFVPESVARTLLADGGTLVAEQAEATVLFCDIEGFTRLTERLGAGGIVELLNEYFETMVDILERHGGIVTQFQGDAILATFNVPVADPAHATNALGAALEMQQAVRLRRFAGESLGCRIGINTGQVVAGAVGARGRLSYTVHGDAVNLAARLEALNKEYGTRILVAAPTAARGHGFALRRVGEVTVRGQSLPVEVFELAMTAGTDQVERLR